MKEAELRNVQLRLFHFLLRELDGENIAVFFPGGDGIRFPVLFRIVRCRVLPGQQADDLLVDLL